MSVPMMARCLIALGSNLGDRSDYLRRALREMAKLAHVRLLTRSRWHETVPIGGPPGQRAFLNGALLLETRLPAIQLLEWLLEIECRLGRQRKESHARDGSNKSFWAPRTVDLDLLLYGTECCESRALRLPHPRMSYRRFVLEPAVEIAGWMPHPPSGSVLARLLWQLNTAGDYVVIVATGMQASAQRAAEWLTHELALKLGYCCWKLESPIWFCQAPEGTLIYGLLPCKGLQPCTADGEKPDVKSLRHVVPVDTGPVHTGPVHTGPVHTGPVHTGPVIGGGESEAGSQADHWLLSVPPKLVIAWEKRAVKDRMVETQELIRGEDWFCCKSGETTLVQTTLARGPMASILTTDPRQALAEALAAIQSIWPAGYDMASGITQA